MTIAEKLQHRISLAKPDMLLLLYQMMLLLETNVTSKQRMSSSTPASQTEPPWMQARRITSRYAANSSMSQDIIDARADRI
jgi:hypothetical protein